MTDNPKDETNILKAILGRPAMHWGNSTNHFHSFIAFLSGYELAKAKNMTDDLHRQMAEIIPSDFHKFVTEYYGYEYPHGGCGWQTFIEMHSSNGNEAIELFQKLRNACIDKKKSAEPGTSHNGGKPPRES